MTSMNPLVDSADPTWHRYRDNFPRQAMGITRYLEGQIMERLTGEYGFNRLRLYYEPYISLVPPEGTRLTDLAEALGISRQAANQTANQIEAAGYIKRAPDPDDGRAKRIVLTEQGIDLRRHGVTVAERLEREVGKLIGPRLLKQSVIALVDFCGQHNLLPPDFNQLQQSRAAMVGLLPRFSDYLTQRLMELTQRRGHGGLKLSFGQVLSLIGPEGGRILQIAALQNVSKQAISAIAGELEEQGYIYREQDPADARQVLLRFTGLGRKLIEDSVIGIDELEAEIRASIGPDALDSLRTSLKKLYHALQLEVSVFSREAPDISQLARDLREKLGPHARRELAELLLK
ncbi:MarR family transcriptional regulator [Parahaliea aestuarii]|uniref:MarR family transcriptional regulator n=2 Tax=Parahaliea aestuarii TaxID=1852021 RepID=A0A5C8ZVB4_9GAMM|nr:MarR family transcriptional regulator [Parahaliea aestuarii]